VRAPAQPANRVAGGAEASRDSERSARPGRVGACTIGEYEHMNHSSDPPLTDDVCVQRAVPVPMLHYSGQLGCTQPTAGRLPNSTGGRSAHARIGLSREVGVRARACVASEAHVSFVRSRSAESRSMSEHTRTYACEYQNSVLWSISASCEQSGAINRNCNTNDEPRLPIQERASERGDGGSDGGIVPVDTGRMTRPTPTEVATRRSSSTPSQGACQKKTHHRHATYTA
jgi:hypothetical protein